MKSLPKIGLYTSTKKAKGMRLCVTDAYGDEPEESYVVEIIDEPSKNDMSAMGDELDKDEWESLVKEYGLEFQG
jgi:hypothetical protein